MSWHYIASAAEADAFLKNGGWSDFKNSEFSAPGWYWKKEFSKPCPRGCCSDRYMTLQLPVNRERDLKKEVANARRELDGLQVELGDAEDRGTMPPPFRPTDAADGFATEDVVALAKVVACGELDKAPILADALEEAGYDGMWLTILRSDYRPLPDDWIHQLAQGISA